MATPLAYLLEEGRAKLAADRLVIYRFYPNNSGHIVGEAVLPRFVDALDERIEDACIPQALMDMYSQGRAIANNDVMASNYHPDHKQLLTRLQVKSNLVVPILQGNNLLGLIVAHHCANLHQWEEWETDYLTDFAIPIGSSFGGFAATERSQYEAEQSRQHARQPALRTLDRRAAGGDEFTGELVHVADGVGQRRPSGPETARVETIYSSVY